MKRCNKFLTVLLVMAVAAGLVLAGLPVPSPAGATPPAAGQQGLIAADNPAEQGVKIQVDGKFLTFDVPPMIENGRTLVPLRALFENLGALVKWEQETWTVTAVKGDLTVRLTIGSNLAYVNDKPVTLDVPAKIVNGRTLVPVRFVSESLGAKVTWDAAIRLVSVATAAFMAKEAEKVAVAEKPTEEVAEKPGEKPKTTPSGGGGGGGGGAAAPPKEIKIVDATGKEITIPQPLERVVVLQGDIATAIKILGVQDRVVGISDTVAKKEYLGMSDKEIIGTWNKPDLEKLAKIAPQVVLALALWPGPELEEQLEPLQIKVVRVNCYIPETLDTDLRILAKMFGKEKRAEDFLKWKNDVIEVLALRTADLNPKLKVFAISSSNLAQGKLGTYGKGSGVHDVIVKAGGINVAGELAGSPVVDPEWVLTQNPGAVLIPCASVAALGCDAPLGYYATDYTAAEKVKEVAINNEVLKQTEAVKKDRVYLLPTELAGGIGGPFAALYLAKWLYPERFQDVNPENVMRVFFEGWLGIPYKGKWSYPPA